MRAVDVIIFVIKERLKIEIMFNPAFEDKNPPLRLLSAFHDVFPDIAPEFIVQVDGRDMWVAGVTTSTQEYTIHAPDIEGKVTFTWRTAKSKRTIMKRPLPKWARYPAGVVVELGANGLDVDGVTAIVIGDEPDGPRYDYALALTIAALWHELTDTDYTPASLQDVVEKVRREYIEE